MPISRQLGGNKTDIAAESAAITIRSEDPSKLYDALYIGRETMRAINQNFVPVIDDQDHFIGIVTRKEIIKYCYKEMKELSILRKKEEADS